MPPKGHEVFISTYESSTYISHNGLSIKADVGRGMDPVFQDEKTGTGSEGHIDRGVIVSEDKVIYVMNRGELLRELHKRFVGTTELICLFMRKSIAFRPSVSETEGKPRMQQTEKKLRNAIMKKPTKESVAERHWTKTVAMP